jgi:hypothetical protein
MSKLGVAIPCYVYHLPKLCFLFDSIANQTVKPDHVVVSCSSTNSDHPYVQKLLSKYLPLFNLVILTTKDRKNASENRNIASRYLIELQVDIISYIDADDMMCSQRLEFIKSIFEKTDSLIVLHSYIYDKKDERLSDLQFDYGKLVRDPSGCALHIENYSNMIHHAHSSIRSDVFRNIQFRESVEFNRREDSVFCGDVLTFVGTRNSYIPIPLSIYYEEGKTVDV